MASAPNAPDQSAVVKKANADMLRHFAEQQWWMIGGEELKQCRGGRKHSKPDVFVQECTEKHASLVKAYESTMMQDSEQRWMRKVCSEGTAGDRIASLVMLIQVCPVFSSKYIKQLLTMGAKMGRSDSMMAVDALRDLFLGSLLPDRKLKTMTQMEPISSKGVDDIQFTVLCVVSYFEDFVKTAFAAFIQILSEAGHHNVEFYKNKSIKVAQDMLMQKPEQERALLSLLVNKFGDNMSKVSSNVAFLLKKLVEEHPGMKTIVTKEVEAFLMRPNVTQKSQYCAVLCLSELVLARNDHDLAAQLVRLFVSRLEEALKPPSARHSAGGKPPLKKRWDQKRKKNVKGLQEDDNRMVRTLINGVQRFLPYCDSVAGSPLQDETVNALFKVCHTVSAFSTRIAILSLLFKSLFSKKAPPERFYRLLHEQLAQYDFFTCAHRLQAAMLLQRAIPKDVSVGRAVAMARRLLQAGGSAEAPVAVVGLGVLRELVAAHRTELGPFFQSARKGMPASTAAEPEDGEEDEVFKDAQPELEAEKQVGKKSESYDPLAREPRFANAKRTPLWELQALANHIHPVVAHNAEQLLVGETFKDYASNPFQEFSSGELLEQFAYAVQGHRTRRGEKGQARIPYNSDKFSKRKNVAPHEKFFQLYFHDATVRKKAARKKQSARLDGSDVDEEVGSGGEDLDDEDEADKFFEGHIKGMMPKGEDEDEDDGGDVDEDEDEDVDFDMSDEGLSDPDAPSGGSAAGSDSDDEPEPSGKGKKRKKPVAKESDSDSEEAVPRHKKIKALRQKHLARGSSVFASAEDFEEMLGEEDLS